MAAASDEAKDDGNKEPPKKDSSGQDGSKQDGAKNQDGGSEGKQQAKGKDDGKPAKRKPVWPWVVAGVVGVGFVAVVLAIIYVPRSTVYTDDAYMTAHYSTIAPQISGKITSVDVEDNQQVRAGQVLVTVDDRDYLAALANAEAVLERDQAQVNNAAGSIQRQPSVIGQSQAQVPSAQAQLTFALANQKRYRSLSATGAGTVQERQQADQAVEQAQAAVDQAKAATESGKRQIPILEAQRAAAAATVKADEAQVQQAKLNLSYTRIVAPLDGMVAQRTVQVGNYVGPGVSLMAVVPLDRIYIEANYREEALRHMLPGQHVRIHVDAYNITLDGVVDSLPPASGAAFGAIQPNNATGNFTKIVQRLPVKIVVTPGQDEAKLLRLGFSVETMVDTGLANVKGEQRNDPARISAR